jgi:hypothetical protein
LASDGAGCSVAESAPAPFNHSGTSSSEEVGGTASGSTSGLNCTIQLGTCSFDVGAPSCADSCASGGEVERNQSGKSSSAIWTDSVARDGIGSTGTCSSAGGAARKRASHPDGSSDDDGGSLSGARASGTGSTVSGVGDSSSGVSVRNLPSQSPDLGPAGAGSAFATGARDSSSGFAAGATGSLGSVLAAGATGSAGLAGNDNPLIGVGGGSFSETGATVSGAKRAPHLLQKTLSTVLGVPHIGQTKPDCCTRRAPQSLQNLLPSRFFVPQCVH